LLDRSPHATVFQTPEFLRAWWASFSRGTLLLLLVERDDAPVALAPLFADGGMVFSLGSGSADYLDVLGDTRDPEVLVALLGAARDQTPGFLGIRLYHLREDSPTGPRLAEAARRLGLEFHEEESHGAPALDAGIGGEGLLAASRKRSLLRHERGLSREGDVRVEHLSRAEEIVPCLPGFFEQHVRRWAGTGHPSLFLDPQQRAFYERLAREAGAAGWIRFTRVLWRERPVAQHFGFCHRGVWLWYKPTYEVELARHSPGEVLLRHLLLQAHAEGCKTFDLGLGEEAFKARFSSAVCRLTTWGLYPSADASPGSGS
jgi:CelD/BcsL family acetyltransferase involved in cellulose biosynthesis